MSHEHAGRLSRRIREYAGSAWPVALCAVLLFGAGAAWTQRTRADPDVPAAQSNTPFDHERHERVACTACHGTGGQHRTLLIRSEQDCQACHHDAARNQACAACHATTELPEPGTIVRPLALSVWDGPRARELGFGHALHTGVECRACHATPPTLAMERTCASCHTEHHSPAANCQSCHATPAAGVHEASAHLSCAGGGCHAAQAAPSPVLSRGLCIACHEPQRTHEPHAVCARCHQIPDSAALVQAAPPVRVP
jgi:hypothetical protein